MQKILLLAGAGVCGTLCRYWVSGFIAKRVGETFPTGTLVVNVVGCFLIGALYFLLEERALVDPAIRTAIMIGFLGAFTTFSSYGLQTFTLVRDGEILLAGIYVIISNVVGFAFVWVGYVLPRALTEIAK